MRALLAAACAAALAGCRVNLEDGATAIANDIESHVRGGSSLLVHRTTPKRGGCGDAYTVQFSKDAGLVVWCYAPGSATEVVSSHITTYHLRFVAVPETTILDKGKGEPLTIEIERGAGKPLVRRVR
jgi:hypothetical protein